MSDAGFSVMAAAACEIADEFCEGRLVMLLEGGYAPSAVSRSIVAVVGVLGGAPATGIAQGPPAESTIAAFEATVAAHGACCGARVRRMRNAR